MKDRKRSGPDDWSSGKYERWLSGTSTGPVRNGYYNRPGELTVACRNRLFRYRFKLGKLAKHSFGFFESSICASSSLPLWLCGELEQFFPFEPEEWNCYASMHTLNQRIMLGISLNAVIRVNGKLRTISRRENTRVRGGLNGRVTMVERISVEENCKPENEENERETRRNKMHRFSSTNLRKHDDVNEEVINRKIEGERSRLEGYKPRKEEHETEYSKLTPLVAKLGTACYHDIPDCSIMGCE
ncbi:hypothetical protein PIB30_059796 [Stylosanthes scabra]|uniref:Uncharacterized protein n=1 Tax=Stylosanthes scabra TaxID=79078 RepID=A0ABU6WLK0_9FABA|nr:hypothetical protein [Stylosanthes scabra]